MAERGGFEPPVRLLTVQRFSKPPPSATRPSLHRKALPDEHKTCGATVKSGKPFTVSISLFGNVPEGHLTIAQPSPGFQAAFKPGDRRTNDHKSRRDGRKWMPVQ